MSPGNPAFPSLTVRIQQKIQPNITEQSDVCGSVWGSFVKAFIQGKHSEWQSMVALWYGMMRGLSRVLLPSVACTMKQA